MVLLGVITVCERWACFSCMHGSSASPRIPRKHATNTINIACKRSRKEILLKSGIQQAHFIRGRVKRQRQYNGTNAVQWHVRCSQVQSADAIRCSQQQVAAAAVRRCNQVQSAGAISRCTQVQSGAVRCGQVQSAGALKCIQVRSGAVSRCSQVQGRCRAGAISTQLHSAACTRHR